MAFFKATYMQTDATTPDIDGPTVLGVVASVLVVVCKRCNNSQQCWKSCANSSNTVALCSTITEQKKCWKFLTQKFDWF